MNALELVMALTRHPEIQPWVAPGHAEPDLTNLNIPGTKVIGDLHGAVVFRPQIEAGRPDVYEMHYLFTEARRGKEALEHIRWAVKEMFTEHGATVICGAVPREHRASRVMSRALGAVPIGSHTDSFGRACVVYKLERKTWATSSAVS